MRWFFRALTACPGCALTLLLGACAQTPPPAVKPAPVAWYLAQHDPATFCPQGYRVPVDSEPDGSSAAFVYLADRQTRFYVPPQLPRHRESALQLRELSVREAEGKWGPVRHGAAWVIDAMLRTAALGVYMGLQFAASAG